MPRNPLAGTYRLLSFDAEPDGVKTQPYGAAPRGDLVLTAARLITVITGDDRKAGTSTDGKTALFDSMPAYSGPYRVEGDRLVCVPDVSWNEAWNGTGQTRRWSLQGTRLILHAGPMPSPSDPSRTFLARAEWEKTE